MSDLLEPLAVTGLLWAVLMAPMAAAGADTRQELVDLGAFGALILGAMLAVVLTGYVVHALLSAPDGRHTRGGERP